MHTQGHEQRLALLPRVSPASLYRERDAAARQMETATQFRGVVSFILICHLSSYAGKFDGARAVPNAA